MTIADWAVTGISVLLCTTWGAAYIRSILGALAVVPFEDEDPPAPEHFPKLSVVIPACNEADSVEEAVSTLMKQDYPELEIILVDDRSTDQTGAIMDDLASSSDRVRVVHVEHLPDGWLGKVHALHVGTQEVSGEWILYTDADVHFRENVLRKAVSLAVADDVGHLTLLPDITAASFWLEVVMHTFGLMFMQTTSAAKLAKPGTDAGVGVGAFNLVRRSAFEKTEGFPWLRMEVVDDVGLGLMMSRSGARSRFSITRGAIHLTWYSSLRTMFSGLEKNLFGAGAHYSLVRMSVMVVMTWAFAAAPAVAILYPGVPYLPLAAVVVYVPMLAVALIGKIKFGKRLLPPLFVQIGHLMMSMMLLRSGIMCSLRGGIMWRETVYPTEELRAGQRVRL